jgi:hypothetical protein
MVLIFHSIDLTLEPFDSKDSLILTVHMDNIFYDQLDFLPEEVL